MHYRDQAEFQRTMLGFLMVGKDKFTTPTVITDKLCQMDAPVGYTESDNGDGTSTYVLNQRVAHEGVGVGFTYKIGKRYVFGQYDSTTNSVTFEEPVPPEEEWSVSWFYAGAFTADFSKDFTTDIPIDAVLEKIITILAYGTLSAWGDKEVGNVLEVRNILTDHDFKMYSPANSARAKVEWRDQMNANMDTLVAELNWRIMGTPSGGSRFGKR
jgi:hypothetical protein